MRCMNCGAEIPEGMLICPDCRTEVQIVPDYNPLEDVLAREVKGSVEDATRPIRTSDLNRYPRPENREYGNSTRVLGQDELDRIRSERMRNTARMNGGSRQNDRQRGNRGNAREMNSRQSTGNMRQTSDNIRRNTGNMKKPSEDRRRQQAVKKKKAARKRMQAVLLVFLVILIVLGVSGYIFYQNSYNGIVGKGTMAVQSADYSAAEKYFNRAIGKDSQRAEAYTGLAKLYLEQGNKDKAENVFLTAIDSQPENVELYKAIIKFYQDTKQPEMISGVLDGCDEKVLAGVSQYIAKEPVFSLEEGTYNEVQQVTLTGEGTIYYTVDGTEPTTQSTKYKEPILINEGTVIIKAITVNKKGIPSLTASNAYTIEIPVEDAPAVTPSTGQYTTPTQITISVPEGYTAYYTMDGTTPSAASSVYTNPIDMPQGTTIFSAVLISKNGKMTQITKRNYVLEL